MDLRSEVRSVVTLWMILIFLSGGLLALDYFKLMEAVKGGVSVVSVPVKGVIWGQANKVQHWWGWWGYWQSGQAELVRLQRVVSEQAGLVARVGDLEQENLELRRLLGADLPSEWEFLPVRVIGSITSNVINAKQNILIVAGGSDAGIQEGMVVVGAPQEQSNQAPLVGRVEQVAAREARIMLLQNSEARISVVIRDQPSGKQRGEGLLIWDTDRLAVEKILPEEQVNVGDVVVTSSYIEASAFDESMADRPEDKGGGGFQGWLPGIPVGVVTEVSFSRETDIYQKARVSWLGEERRWERVFVVVRW